MAQHLRKSPEQGMEYITTMVEVEVRAELLRLAKADDRTLSAYVRRVLRHHVQEQRA
jgi:hypothetical protein